MENHQRNTARGGRTVAPGHKKYLIEYVTEHAGANGLHLSPGKGRA